MVKINRTPTPPPSLETESQKAHGSYSEQDVIRQLNTDFYGKCYLCEIGNLQSVQVEHLRPHHNRERKDFVFDWNNLFLSCPHCNNMKKDTKYDDKIIDCCVVDPEVLLEHRFEGGHVHISSLNDTEESILTADLITNCFEKTNTGIREIECQTRITQLSIAMNKLYKCLDSYKSNANNVRYYRSLRSQLSRSSEFAGFKRFYVKSHIVDYPGLEDLLA